MRKSSKCMRERSGGVQGGAQFGHFMTNDKGWQLQANPLLRALLQRSIGGAK